MDHKGSASLSISSLGVNRLLHGNGSSYPTIETPQKLTQLLPMIPFRDWTKIQGRIGECNLFYSPVSPCSQNPRSSHNATSTLSLGWNTLHTDHIKIPKVIKHELPHNHSKNPWHTYHLPCVDPKKKTCKTSRPLLDILGIAKVQASGFFWSNSPNQVLSLPNYNTQNTNRPHTC
jgi:hypothetical protein